MAEMKKLPPVTKVPPDGGWGWVICAAYSLSLILVIPIMQSFGLIYNKKFKELGLSATDTAIIINTNAAFGMTMGLVNGLLLKQFGYRKIAILAGIFVSVGVISTAFANSFQFFFISYGLITSLGFSLTMAAFSLALNSYFQKKRGIATGFAVTATGLGPIVMPLFINVLLDYYGTTGCMLILGALSLNSIAAGVLLQPLKWHMKLQIPDLELQRLDAPTKDEEKLTVNLLSKDENLKKGTEKFNSTLSIDHDVETRSIYGFETPLPRRKTSTGSVYEPIKTRIRTFSRGTSQIDKSTLSIDTLTSLKSVKEENEKVFAEEEEEPPKLSLCRRIFNFFDLDLLTDPVYLNLMFGMSLAIFAEINFSLLTPFILNDFNFPNYQIAQLMSTIASADIVFRFCAPFIANWLNISPKLMYMFSLILLVTSRTALIFVRSFLGMIVVALALGVAKGFRTVFMSLLIPSYVPIEKLASASGLQMVANGVLNMVGGPILGVIRDVTGSYDNCILVINGITTITLAMWTLEYIYIKCFKKSV